MTEPMTASMTEPAPALRVLFLALGATRKRAVTIESGEVLDGDGAATVVVSAASAWPSDSFAAAVRVVDLAELTRGHLPMAAERAILYAAPRIMFGLLSRGRAGARVNRVATAYRSRVADRVHRRLFLPLYRRLWPGAPYRLIQRELRVSPAFTHIVVTDPDSLPLAARMWRTLSHGGEPLPVMSYALGDVVAPPGPVDAVSKAFQGGLQ